MQLKLQFGILLVIAAVVTAPRAVAAVDTAVLLGVRAEAPAFESVSGSVSRNDSRSVSHTDRSFSLPMAFSAHHVTGLSRSNFSPHLAAPSGGASDDLYVDWVTPLQTPAGAANDAATGPEGAPGSPVPDASSFGADRTQRTAPIPEPQTLTLMAVGLLPLAGLGLRRRHKDRA